MKKLLMIPIIAVSILVSCKKENLKELTSSSVVTNSNKSIKLDNSPQNINGILTFTSEEHLQQYYETLDEMVDAGHDEDKDVDALLKEVEDGLNFLSYRQSFINKFDWEDKEFTAEEIDEMYKRDFIIDEVRKSILNEYLEVGIGDYIYVYFSDNQVYKIPKLNFDIVIDFRDIEKGKDDFFPKNTLKNGVELLSGVAMLSIDTDEIGSAKDSYYREYQRTAYITNVNCEIHNKSYYASLKSRYYDTIDSSLTNYELYPVDEIIIDFGDNTSESFTSSEVSGSHFYSNLGTYTVTYTFKYKDDNNNQITRHRTTTVLVNGACTRENASKTNSEEYNQNNGDKWNMDYSTWVRKDIFGRHLGAYTHAWLWNSRKSKWKRAKTSLFCRIEGSFRDDDCIIGENLAKSKTKYGKRLSSKKHRIKKWWQIDNGDINSEHQLHGTSTYYKFQEINPCD